MTMTSPGPWRLGSPTVTHHDYPEPYDSEVVSVRAANDAQVAIVNGGHQHVPFVSLAEYVANARLIAAAPRLFEALCGMVGLVQLIDRERPDLQTNHRFIEALAAIEQVEGREAANEASR